MIQIKKWGNSQGIILPKEIMRKLNLHIDDILEEDIQGNRLILYKRVQHLTLEERAAPYGNHINTIRLEEWEKGDPEGNEIL